MKILVRWPIPEAIVCFIIGGIAGGIINDLPAGILTAVSVGLTIGIVGAYLRTRYDPSVRRWLQDQPDSEPQPHNPQDRQL